MSYNHLCQQKQNFIMVHFMKCFRRIIRHHTLTLTASLLGPTRSMAEEGWQHAKDEPMEAKKEESEAEPDTTPQRKVKKALGMAITEANFREVALNACQQQLEAFGNPVQYLKHYLGPEGNEKLVNFGNQLSTAFPRRADLSYLDGTLLPRVLEETHVFRISLWQLGFLGCCSSKPPTFRVTAAALMDEYLTNTFLTAGDPLLLYQQPEDLPAEMQIPGFPGQCYFWTHYLKGAARASSILMLAHVLLNLLHVDVSVLSPNLHQSMLAVHCRFGTAASDLATIAMENARFSARGSIRKNHDVVTWAVKLHTLKRKGLQPPEIIKKFNANSTEQAALQGAKRVGVLQLLELPPSCLSVLIEHVSQYGFNGCAFSEKVLSNKKIAPGFQPRANNDREWQRRLVVTDAGFELFLRYVDATHARKKPSQREKWDITTITTALQMSQCLLSCLSEIQDQHAVPASDRDKIVQDFLAEDKNFELELQGAISELKKGWQPAEITRFKELIATCIAKRDGTLESIGKGPKISAGQLEKQSFELLLSSLQHDADSYSVWKAKCSDRESALYFQRLNHQSLRHGRAREMAETVFAEDRGLEWQMTLSKLLPQDASNISTWQDTCSHIARQCQLQANQVRSICVLNWAATAVFSSATQQKQAKLMGAIVNSNGGESKSIGLTLTPSFFYKKGSLYKTVESSNKLLASADCNIDTAFAVAFEGRNDERQKRSLLQPGVLILPADPKIADAVWQHWKGTDIFKYNLVKDAPLPLSSELVEIEEMSEMALPQGTDDKTHPAPAEKFQQIGHGAAFKLLSATVTNAMAEGDRKALLVVDLGSRTLDFAKAVYKLRESVKTPLYYLGFAETDEQIEWQQFHLSQWLALGYLDGTLQLPAGAPPLGSAELPAELVTAAPAKPDLGTLTWSTKKKDGLPTLKTPDKILQT